MQTRYWTPEERNLLSTTTPTGDLLWNRLLWTGVGLVFLSVANFTFLI